MTDISDLVMMAAGSGGRVDHHSCKDYKSQNTVLSFLAKVYLLGCEIFIVLKIKYLNIVSDGAAVTLNLKSSLFTDCILYLLENDTKWQ